MYKKRGYYIYQVIPGYYSADANFPEEAAYDMRKPLSIDTGLSSLQLAVKDEARYLADVYK